MNFDIDDRVGAWVPHGRFMLPPTRRGALDGLRFAVKDVFDVAGHPTGAGNPTWLATHAIPTRHAGVVQQLLDAGATLAGKVLTDELAYSLHGDNAHYGTPVNSAAPDCVPGGSSSGSSAAVAARLVDFALGTDTGGSTRVPASYAGLWGLRTTHGLVPREGLVPLHPSFDTATWLAHEAGIFERVGAVLLPEADWAPRRVLVPRDAWTLADEVFQVPLQRARDALAHDLSASVEEATWGGEAALADWRQVYATAGAFEGWQVHGAWIQAQQPHFGAPIAARWRAASAVTAQDAARAREQAGAIRAAVRARLGPDGVAVLPSAASLAPRRDADPASVDAVRLRTMAITCIAGLAGLPQVSLPLRSDAPRPLGISLLGAAGSDLALIRLARRLHARIA
ncbi:amidase [Ramlibacter rhizophilus]|uniref:Amidase n=1 Tax=Ramlibacter rhizophilus TaxID=1781167 RepID=A0A4Z0BKT2_9BURK|nr:amidase [Ramlibacter rhizophilus]TFY98508.1 amidase [Ramlibacter rhizophilus]